MSRKRKRYQKPKSQSKVQETKDAPASSGLSMMSKFLGLTTLAGILATTGATVGAYLKYPPELMVESIPDPSKEFNGESRIQIKNTGLFTAYNITNDAESFNMKWGRIVMKDGGMNNVSMDTIQELSGGESTSITMTRGMKLPPNTAFNEYAYTLKTRYEARFLFFSKPFEKTWKIELRQRKDGYSWNIQKG